MTRHRIVYLKAARVLYDRAAAFFSKQSFLVSQQTFAGTSWQPLHHTRKRGRILYGAQNGMIPAPGA
jgi:hypothetical protein